MTASLTALQSPIDRQPNGLNAMNRIQRNGTVSWQGYGLSILGCGIIFIDYLVKGQIIHNEYNIALLERLNYEIKKNGSI
jgi:hypothetical protein